MTINDARPRVSIPLPASVTLNDPHLFVDTDNIVDPAADKFFSREGDVLIVETQRANSWSANSPPDAFEALLSLGTGTELILVSHSAEAPVVSTNGYQSASSSSSTTIANTTNASTTGEQGSPTLLLSSILRRPIGRCSAQYHALRFPDSQP